MKVTNIIALVVIAIAVGAIFLVSSDYTTYENFKGAESRAGKQFHVVGQLVKEKPQIYNPLKDPNFFAFYMKDDQGEVRRVVYRGAKPDGFDRSEKIVISGTIEGQHFTASKILMKCPSKYVNEDIKLKKS